MGGEHSPGDTVWEKWGTAVKSLSLQKTDAPGLGNRLPPLVWCKPAMQLRVRKRETSRTDHQVLADLSTGALGDVDIRAGTSPDGCPQVPKPSVLTPTVS